MPAYPAYHIRETDNVRIWGVMTHVGRQVRAGRQPGTLAGAVAERSVHDPSRGFTDGLVGGWRPGCLPRRAALAQDLAQDLVGQPPRWEGSLD